MTPRVWLLYLGMALPLAAGACSRGEPERAQQGAAAAQDTGGAFGGRTAAVHRPARPGAPRGGWLLRAVRAEPQPGYDRVVFEFAGDSLPGYRVEYATGPVVRCGSGDPVTVAGSGRLVVRFEPARAHDDQGNATIAPQERTAAPGLPAIKDLQIVCDFEGQVEWVLGVAAAAPYRVTEMAEPARLVLDVRHRPGP